MNRGLVRLLVLAIVTVAAGAVGFSSASFTTSSQTQIGATASGIQSWLHLYSQSTDPSGTTGYAVQRVQSGTPPLCAVGSDATLTLNMGGAKSGGTYTFNKAFALRTPPTFPGGSVTQISVAATYVADQATGKQPISSVKFGTSTGGSNPYTMNRNAVGQANVVLKLSGSGWVTGQVYTPHILVTVTYTGFTSTYYQYNIPLASTVATW